MDALFYGKGGDCEIVGKNDEEDFRRLLSAMEILHFSAEDQSSVFRILSSILHLGNVFFERYEVLNQMHPPCLDFPHVALLWCSFAVMPWIKFNFFDSIFGQTESQEVAYVVSAQEIRVVAEILQISPEGLQKSITFKVTVRKTCLIMFSMFSTKHYHIITQM